MLNRTQRLTSAGNQVGAGSDTFAYNLADRMTSAAVSGTTTTYSYDGDGVRLDATSGSTTTRFLWDVNNPLPLLALETDGSGGVLRRYAYGHDLVSMEDASGSYSFHGDHLGSVIEVTNASGATQWEYGYEPYGVATTTTQVDPNAPANAMRFTGQYLDGTGLYHLRARQYDPGTGVFGATDPVNPGLDQPYIAAYGYVGGHPTALIDPSGEIGLNVIGGFVGGIVGGGASLVSQAVSGDGIDWGRVGTDAAVGAVAGATLGTCAWCAGAVAGFGSSYADGARTGRMPTWQEAGISAVFGAFGGGLGARYGARFRFPNTVATGIGIAFGVGGNAAAGWRAHEFAGQPLGWSGK